ncbi:tail fiber domain-containing protein [Stenotrophomonas sp. GD03701]|uniref:Tail fiber domain-containing protein n=1 Tax=Stenotrophomonas maltophilia TaxID=40324 RepID=A0A2J0SQ76_STEMA|nr:MULTISPECIES: tail fiber domain-containing protein [Stenotrophomonas]MBA0311928.1 tail fiber domain-containing protein [Stenotrophomonas maltophilia]MDH1388428.1 tail fiber domain-containing protein [Stenotrophomonas sp. GD03701]MDH1392005.1 tail fiber domain-containing protein [Stenotrophomonas sp. GD03702]MDQ7302236.1 tail fiber domain-containing protein [Stenotrophomonas sp. Sm0581]PJK99431.1 phage tail protein [Stenotrophomonas maltophilia]
MRLKITDAGFAKLVNPPNTGTNAVLITQIGLTSTAFVPSAGLTALPGEIKRVATFGGQAVGDDTVHVTIRDDSATSYTLRGFGLYLADGTLFASYGQADPIMEKSAASMLLLATDTRFSGIDTTQIQFGDAGFLYPPATTEVVGVVELATSTEAEDATDTQRAVTPRGLRAYTDKRFGASAPTALAKTLLSAANTTAARTALELKSAALKDTGHGNGLDADTLDGKHASEFALAGDFATVGHKHVIADVTGLQPALDGKASRGGNTFTDQQFISGTYPLMGFGAAGAEQSFIGGWGNSSLWRVWSADRSASSEITIKHGDTPRWNGSPMWHAGNFAPDTKMDKSGGTFTGHVGVNGNSLRSYGWNGVPNDGVIVLGDANSYIFKNGSNFTFANSAGGFTSTLSTGGSIWTSGNFDPASKINRTGDTVTGSLRVNAYLYTQAAAGHNLIRFISNGAGTTVLQSVNPAENAFAPLELRGSTVSVIGPASFNETVTTVGSLISAGGCVRTNAGTDVLAGYVAFHRADGTRMGYVGWGDGNRIQYSAENGFTGHAFIGSVSATGGYDFGSSRKLKNIEGVLPYGLAAVEKMELAAGHYKPEYNDDGRRRLFFVAEQLAELVPEAVDLEGVEFQGERVASVKLDQLLPVMAKAIQELAAEVRALKAER